MNGSDEQDKGSTSGQLTRRRFLGTSGKFLVYTSPVLTTLLTADRALAVSVYPYLVVEARNPLTGSFTGMPATGDTSADTTAQWTMQPELEIPFSVVSYRQYFVGISSTGSNPVSESVNVKITWTRLSGGALDVFRWGGGPIAGSDQTVTVPAGGGTLGIGGTIVDSVIDPWPTINVDQEFTGTVGRVVFERVSGAYSNLKKLTINVAVTAQELD